jgi:hypothetical protein
MMKIHFATIATSRYWTTEPVLLAKSLRTFGGEFTNQPITVLTPEGQILSPEVQSEFDQLSIQSVEFSLPEEAANFPLGLVPHGAAAAETYLADQANILVWLLPDALVLNPPTDFALPTGKYLGYRPVHHQNVGSSFGQPPDDFWQQIFSHTQVPEDHNFRMETCYREEVWPYFNAGILAVRPELGILRQWADVFTQTYQHPDFIPFYQNQLYAIFMHQAILSGVILQKLHPKKLISLPESYNYPLHMHKNYPAEGKIKRLSDLVTARYESTPELPNFIQPFEDKEAILDLLNG